MGRTAGGRPMTNSPRTGEIMIRRSSTGRSVRHRCGSASLRTHLTNSLGSPSDDLVRQIHDRQNHGTPTRSGEGRGLPDDDLFSPDHHWAFSARARGDGHSDRQCRGLTHACCASSAASRQSRRFVNTESIAPIPTSGEPLRVVSARAAVNDVESPELQGNFKILQRHFLSDDLITSVLTPSSVRSRPRSERISKAVRQ